MRRMLKKSARKIVLAAVATIVLTVGAVSVVANTLTYLGSDDNTGEQYYLGCGSSSGDYDHGLRPSYEHAHVLSHSVLLSVRRNERLGRNYSLRPSRANGRPSFECPSGN